MANTGETRRYDIDWLRIIAVLLLIPFHTLHIFILKPYSIVYIKNSTGSDTFDAISFFISSFHMPLLFFLAGASSYLSLQVRSISQYLKERILRLMVPLITGIVILIPPMTYIYRISIGDKLSLLSHYMHFFSDNPGDLSGVTGAFTPAHLWFILFLFVFSIIGIPLFVLMNRKRSEKRSNFMSKRLCLILLTIPLALVSAVNILEDKNPLVYFTIFIIGYYVMTRDQYQEAINRDKLVYLLLGLVFETILQCYANDFPEWSFGWVFYELMRTANRLVWVYAIVGYGHQLLNRPSKVLSYLSKAAFPVYILHMPINTVVGYFVVQMNLGIYLKAIIIIMVTTILTFIVYEIIRRSKAIRFLLGIKHTINKKP